MSSKRGQCFDGQGASFSYLFLIVLNRVGCRIFHKTGERLPCGHLAIAERIDQELDNILLQQRRPYIVCKALEFAQLPIRSTYQSHTTWAAILSMISRHPFSELELR